MVTSIGFGVREVRGWIVALPLTSCVALSKSLILAEPHSILKMLSV